VDEGNEFPSVLRPFSSIRMEGAMLPNATRTSPLAYNAMRAYTDVYQNLFLNRYKEHDE
jgi:hypothetical protein